MKRILLAALLVVACSVAAQPIIPATGYTFGFMTNQTAESARDYLGVSAGSTTVTGSFTLNAGYGFLVSTNGTTNTGTVNTNLMAERAWVTNRELAINVRDLGAVGDGVTDDTDAIQVAFNLASNTNRPGSVFIPAGIYLLSSSLFPPPAIHVFGEGKLDNDQTGQFTNFLHNASILKAWSNFPAIVVSNATHVRFSDFQISGLSNPVQNIRYDFLPNSTNANLYSSSFGIVTTNSSSFEGGHMRLEGMAINGFRTAFLANKLWDSSFRHVEFTGNEIGFQGINTIDALSIENCNFGWHSNGVGLVFNGVGAARGVKLNNTDSGNMMQFARFTNAIVEMSGGNMEGYSHSTNLPLISLSGDSARLSIQNMNFQTISNYTLINVPDSSSPIVEMGKLKFGTAFHSPASLAGAEPLTLHVTQGASGTRIKKGPGTGLTFRGVLYGPEYSWSSTIHNPVGSLPANELSIGWRYHGLLYVNRRSTTLPETFRYIYNPSWSNPTNLAEAVVLAMDNATRAAIEPVGSMTVTNLSLGALTNATLSTNSGVTNLNISINGTTYKIQINP